MMMFENVDFDDIVDFDSFLELPNDNFNTTDPNGVLNHFHLSDAWDLEEQFFDCHTSLEAETSDSESAETPISHKRKQPRTYKKHKKAKKDKEQIPSIDASDIRRQYAAMFTNTLNSSDPERFTQYLARRCTEDFKFIQTLSGAYAPQTHPSVLQLEGRELVAQFWHNRVQLMPDIIYTLLNSMVCTYSNTAASKVIANINVFATKPFDAPVSKYIPQTGSQEEGGEEQVGEKRKAPTVTDYYEKFLHTVPLLSQPVLFDCEGKLILHLNENMMIDKMEFHVLCNKHVSTDLVYN